MTELQKALAPKRAFIFDLFHTLTSLEIISGGQGLRISDLLGVGYDDWTRQLVAYARDRWIGKLDDAFTIIRTMAHAIDPTIPEEPIRAVLANRQRCFRAAMREMSAENIEVLRQLKAHGKKVALLSNADVLEAAFWLECPAASLFDVTIFSCQVGLAKPDPAIYRHCLEQLGVRAEDAVFVGDGGSDELVGARQVGLTTVMATGIIKQYWPERIEQRRAAADFVVERLVELT